ncbi:hypothetical protein V5O48_015355 [Marasmius crinis-equi]|uniref:Uncharacterized protein n=1 Tax=Marasmius crinis-equi TaxID=585013 RepID=A0ABR3EUT3_9AGAR
MLIARANFALASPPVGGWSEFFDIRGHSFSLSEFRSSFQSINDASLEVLQLSSDRSVSIPNSASYAAIDSFSEASDAQYDPDDYSANEYNPGLNFLRLRLRLRLRLKLNFVLDPQSHELFVDYHAVKHSKYSVHNLK